MVRDLSLTASQATAGWERGRQLIGACLQQQDFEGSKLPSFEEAGSCNDWLEDLAAAVLAGSEACPAGLSPCRYAAGAGLHAGCQVRLYVTDLCVPAQA